VPEAERADDPANECERDGAPEELNAQDQQQADPW
jgi:hypothetical protein